MMVLISNQWIGDEHKYPEQRRGIGLVLAEWWLFYGEKLFCAEQPVSRPRRGELVLPVLRQSFPEIWGFCQCPAGSRTGSLDFSGGTVKGPLLTAVQPEPTCSLPISAPDL